MQSYNKYNEKAEAAEDNLQYYVKIEVEKTVEKLLKTEESEYLGLSDDDIWKMLLSELKDLQRERDKKIKRITEAWKNG